MNVQAVFVGQEDQTRLHVKSAAQNIKKERKKYQGRGSKC